MNLPSNLYLLISTSSLGIKKLKYILQSLIVSVFVDLKSEFLLVYSVFYQYLQLYKVCEVCVDEVCISTPMTTGRQKTKPSYWILAWCKNPTPQLSSLFCGHNANFYHRTIVFLKILNISTSSGIADDPYRLFGTQSWCNHATEMAGVLVTFFLTPLDHVCSIQLFVWGSIKKSIIIDVVLLQQTTDSFVYQNITTVSSVSINLSVNHHQFSSSPSSPCHQLKRWKMQLIVST